MRLRGPCCRRRLKHDVQVEAFVVESVAEAQVNLGSGLPMNVQSSALIFCVAVAVLEDSLRSRLSSGL